MKNPLKVLALVAAPALVSACTSEDLDHFLNSNESTYQPSWIGYNAPSQSAGVARCYQTSRDRQTCFR